MTERKIKIKKLEKSEGIKELELGDIVELRGYGKAVFYGQTLQSLIFLGRRKETDDIYQLEVSRGHLTPMQDGSLGVGAILSERTFFDYNQTISPYDFKEMILIPRGI